MATPQLTITPRIPVLITKQSALSTTNQQPPSKTTATKVTAQSTSTSRIAVDATKKATLASTNPIKPSPKATASMASPWLTITSRITAVVITKQLKPTDTKETAKFISNQDTKAISTSVSLSYFNITSATLSSSTFTISGKFLFKRCENNKENKILVEERGGVKVPIYF